LANRRSSPHELEREYSYLWDRTQVTLRARKLLAYAAALSVLLAVFALYTRPLFLVTLADQIWACFGR
jgi:hypothetical protein